MIKDFTDVDISIKEECKETKKKKAFLCDCPQEML